MNHAACMIVSLSLLPGLGMTTLFIPTKNFLDINVKANENNLFFFSA
jgi:hypothetical protein